MSMKHLVSIADLTREDSDRVIARAEDLKAAFRREGASHQLKGKSLAMIFHKPSLRTRVSFEVGMTQLGGAALYITDREIGMDTREAVEDIARVLSGYADGVVIRTFHQVFVERLAEFASIPVINALTDLSHPCQILADLLTIKENGRSLDDLAIAYIGDGNNCANSFINAAALYKIDLRIAHPAGFPPDTATMERATGAGATVTLTNDPVAAVTGTDVVYTDVWTSMGQEDEREDRLKRFEGFQVNPTLMSHAKGDALFMHCLPAHRGEEVDAAVIDGPNSVVFQEAENRLHLQKGLLDVLMRG